MTTDQYNTNCKVVSHPKNNVGVSGEGDYFDEVVIDLKSK